MNLAVIVELIVLAVAVIAFAHLLFWPQRFDGRNKQRGIDLLRGKK